jgi:hypothetical protein
MADEATEERFCRDCRWVYKREESAEQYRCTRFKVQSTSYLVSGEPKNAPGCSWARGPFGPCGPGGKEWAVMGGEESGLK